MKRKFLILVAVLAVACWAPAAWALTIALGGEKTVSATGTAPDGDPLSASATFALSADGHTLTITLRNTSGTIVDHANEVLTAVLWSTTSPLGSITTAGHLGTDTAPAGSTLYNNTYGGSVPLNLKGEWGYGDTTGGNPLPYGNRYLSSFDGPTTMYGAGVQLAGSATVPDGIDFGLVGTGGVIVPSPFKGNLTLPLVGNSSVFTVYFATALDGYNLDPSSVVFQYGTSFDEPHTRVPLPPTALLLGSGLLGLGLLGWRRKRRS